MVCRWAPRLTRGSSVSAASNASKSAGVGETHEGHVPGVAAPVHLLEHAGVRPDLGFGDAASRGEPADHLPGGPPHINPVADEQTLEGARGAVADDDLVPARLEVPPLHDSIWSRSAKAAASTPRSGTFASVPTPIFLRSMITKSSGETRGPSGPTRHPGASQRTWMS